jgi:hypothetical protein
MLLDNISELIKLMEDVVYSDPEEEYTRNLENLAGMVKSTIHNEDGCTTIAAKVPANVASYGPGLASIIANKVANKI